MNKKQKKTKNINITKRNFKNFDKENFILDLLAIDWDETLNLNKKNVNHSFDSLFNNINKLLNIYAPYKKITKKEHDLQLNPWLTPGILNSIRIRDSLLKKLIKTKNQAKKLEIHNSYKLYRNTIVTLIRQSKTNHFQKFFSDNTNNIKKTWEGINNIINIRNTNKSVPTCIKIGESHLTDPKEIAKTFNDYFSSIATNIEKKLIKTNKLYTDYLNQPNQNSIFLSPVMAEEIKTLILSLKINKAEGPNSIPTKILKLIINEISQPLANIINLSLETGVFPNMLKTAAVIPVHKKSSKLLCSNYRPISLLSNISKIFENIMHKKLYTFLNKNNCLYESQFGFRQNHSTNHTLVKISEQIQKAIDTGQFACGVFIDLQKAFDTVNHNILLGKLSYYGIRGVALHWFQSYLSMRNQHVNISGVLSQNSDICYGVPQGSVLGPLLFLIYINDLNKAIRFSAVHHFADDTNLLYINKSLKKINQHVNHDLQLLCHWLRANKISLNVDKTELVIFRSKTNKIKKHLNFRMSGQKITPTNHLKYLGIYLQFWQKINGQTSKFARKLHFLGIRKVLNLGLKAEKPLQNENHTEDWALDNHPRDNGHVTH